MKTIYFILLIFLLSLTSCGQTQVKDEKGESQFPKHTNMLIHESSPYLLQHAHNPVNWYPWGNEALEKARVENKLIIISIGYSACHWCHVMEHESFEDEDVAKFMNENFVSIKVDREERPDIDQVYMNAVQLLTGSGGWPLNCIALPDGRPIYGGTYFPKAQWIEMLKGISDFVKQNPEKTEQQAKSLTQGIQSSEMVFINSKSSLYSVKDLNSIFFNWEKDIDYTLGGFKRAPKFPMPVGYQFLLQYHFLTKNESALKAVKTTLDKMAEGGIYDQIGGGFARYSTDLYWKVPHFEKMLYDNSQLVSLYSLAYQKSKDPGYEMIVNETLGFIEREMTSPEGGFYSSLDADSEGEEGKYYVWTKNELQNLLRDKGNLIMDYYNVTEEGNWESGHNILYIDANSKKITNKYEITDDELERLIIEAKQTILNEREKRIRPGLDDKVITSWNALMLKGYVDAYRVFNNKKYLNTALKNAEFINKSMRTSNNRLFRSFKNGKVSINAFLDDYAFTIAAFISLYQATFNEKWLIDALQLTEYAITHFYDENRGMFYYTSDIDPPLVARKMEISDNVIPASNSEMAKNLYVLGLYFYNDTFIEKAKTMVNHIKKNALEGGIYYANWDILMTWIINEPYEVAIVGNDFESIRKEFDQEYLPNIFLSGGENEGSLSLLENKLVKGQTTIYVCQDKVCKLPVTEVKKALTQIIK